MFSSSYLRTSGVVSIWSDPHHLSEFVLEFSRKALCFLLRLSCIWHHLGLCCHPHKRSLSVRAISVSSALYLARCGSISLPMTRTCSVAVFSSLTLGFLHWALYCSFSWSYLTIISSSFCLPSLRIVVYRPFLFNLRSLGPLFVPQCPSVCPSVLSRSNIHFVF